MPLTVTDGSAVVRSLNSSAAPRVVRAGAVGGELLGARRERAPARELLLGRRHDPGAERLGQATVRPRDSTAESICISACVAVSAAPPNMPEWRSRSPVRTVTWK